jgi:2-iminoacetate synthase ThiH
VVVSSVPRVDGPQTTGEEVLRAIALARLSTPVSRAVAVGWDHVGLQLAQTALVFGANVLFGGIGAQGVLPLADNPGIRRQEITGLVQRALRTPQWVETAQAQLESRS